MQQKAIRAARVSFIHFTDTMKRFQWPVLVLLLGLACTGCDVMHEQAQASMDYIKVNNKGVSYTEEADKPRVAADYALLVTEALAQGGANSGYNGYHKPFSSNRHFGTAGASNDDIFMPGDFYAAGKAASKGSWYISQALDFTNIRTKYSSQGFDYSVKLFYLQIPVLINYSYPLDEDNSLHAGIGPYAGIGLSGKFKSDVMERSIKFGSDENNDDLKRMNFGLEINGGFRFMKKWDATLSYQLGLRNVSATAPDPDTKIRGLSLSVGYWFH